MPKPIWLIPSQTVCLPSHRPTLKIKCLVDFQNPNGAECKWARWWWKVHLLWKFFWAQSSATEAPGAWVPKPRSFVIRARNFHLGEELPVLERHPLLHFLTLFALASTSPCSQAVRDLKYRMFCCVSKERTSALTLNHDWGPGQGRSWRPCSYFISDSYLSGAGCE